MTVVFALLSIPLYDYMVIIASSVFGSYLAWRGLSMLLGGFPSEFAIGVALKSKQIQGLSFTFWIWITLMFISAVLCVYMQLNHR